MTYEFFGHTYTLLNPAWLWLLVFLPLLWLPWYTRIDMMTDMVIDVVPEETIHLVTHDGSGSFQLSDFPRCIVMFSNEPHAIQQGKNISL